MNKYVIDKEKRLQLGKFIKEKREEKGFGMNQLAAKISVTNSLIHRLENGQTQKISPFLLKEVASGLRIDYKELYKIVGYLEKEEFTQKQEGNIGEIYEVSRIPLYESISAGCGFETADIIDYLHLPNIKNPELYFGVKVKGDSMEPTIKDGSIIVIKKDEDIPDGRIGAFIVDNASYVKRIYRSKNETQLVSDNRAYPPINVREGNEYFECGRVVKVLVDGMDL